MNKPDSNESKGEYCEYGLALEEKFLQDIEPLLKGVTVRWNPKKEEDKYTHDYELEMPDGRVFPADLKSQNAPFFMANKKYGMDASMTVVFNDKDLKRYTKLYPNIIILFSVKWEETQKNLGDTTYRVFPTEGVWAVSLKTIQHMIDVGRAPLHTYKYRVNDTKGNAKGSYLLNLDDMTELLRIK